MAALASVHYGLDLSHHNFFLDLRAPDPLTRIYGSPLFPQLEANEWT